MWQLKEKLRQQVVGRSVGRTRGLTARGIQTSISSMLITSKLNWLTGNMKTLKSKAKFKQWQIYIGSSIAFPSLSKCCRVFFCPTYLCGRFTLYSFALFFSERYNGRMEELASNVNTHPSNIHVFSLEICARAYLLLLASSLFTSLFFFFFC